MVLFSLFVVTRATAGGILRQHLVDIGDVRGQVRVMAQLCLVQAIAGQLPSSWGQAASDAAEGDCREAAQTAHTKHTELN